MPRVVDGDTLHCVVDLGFFVTIDVDVRLNGIDAPELHGQTHTQGAKVKLAVEQWVKTLWPIGMVLESALLDKYRRSLGNIRATTGESLCAHLLEIGYAKPYNGGTKQPWTDAELYIIDHTR